MMKTVRQPEKVLHLYLMEEKERRNGPGVMAAGMVSPEL